MEGVDFTRQAQTPDYYKGREEGIAMNEKEMIDSLLKKLEVGRAAKVAEAESFEKQIASLKEIREINLSAIQEIPPHVNNVSSRGGGKQTASSAVMSFIGAHVGENVKRSDVITAAREAGNKSPYLHQTVQGILRRLAASKVIRKQGKGVYHVAKQPQSHSSHESRGV